LRRTNGKGTFVAEHDAPLVEPLLRRPMTLLIPSSGVSRDSHYFPDLLSGFEDIIKQYGMNIMPYNWENPKPPSNLASGTAIACLMTSFAHFGIVEGLRDFGYPVLAINRYSGRRTIPTVRIDDKRGVEKAVDYLVGLGHRNLGFVRAVADNIDARERLRGFRSAVRKHEIANAIEHGDDFTEASGYAAAKQMLNASDRPTAIVCASDLSALGVLQAARDAGLSLPSDLSVVGFGDFSVANGASPRLTTVRQDRVSLAKQAADSLLMLANGEEIGSVTIPAELVIRDSVSAAAPA